MRVECHQLDRKYQVLRVRRRREEAQLAVRYRMEGQDSPVPGVRTAEDRFVVLDGFGRLEALRLAGLDEAEVVLVDGDEAEALVQVYRMVRTGGWDAVEEALLVQALMDRGWSQAQVSHRLARTVSWVSRRLSLLKTMPPEILARVLDGAISAHGAQRALVPLARANSAAAMTLMENIEGERLSSRSLARLWECWRDGDAKARQWVVSHPIAVLKALGDRPPGP